MNASVFLLIFIGILKLNWCFSLADEDNIEQDGAVTEFPFSKAKVKYHRSRYCITAFGQTNCVRMNKEPGDAAELAKLYRIMLQGYQDSALRMSKEKALKQKIKPALRQRGQAVNEETVQLIKPRTLDDDEQSQLSQHLKPRKLTQDLHQNIKMKASEQSKFIKPNKLSQEVTPTILNERTPPKFREFPYPSTMKETVRLKKYDNPKPRWQIAGGKPNHIPPIPRRNGD